MPLVTTSKMLLDAQREGYAVGAFNVENMEMMQAVISAAEETRAPVIIQITPGTARYAPLKLFFANVAALVCASPVPVALHLDHGNSFELAVQAIRSGFSSVMIDGSAGSFEANIELTKRVVSVAKPVGVPAEAELGEVGGKEDGLDGGCGGYTDPDEAKEFAERTGINSLAVAIGTMHGIYHTKPKLDIRRLHEIRKRVTVPLVLHGASGLADEDIRECIRHGICKVNFATELRIAFTGGVKEVLRAMPDTIDPKKCGVAGRERVKSVVVDKIRLCGCHDRV